LLDDGGAGGGWLKTSLKVEAAGACRRRLDSTASGRWVLLGDPPY
jgi:hypothetical protein